MHVNCYVLRSIDHCDCPHVLWKNLWEIYGDHDTPPFPNDHVSKCHSSDQVSHDVLTIQEVVCSNVLSRLETIGIPSLSMNPCPESFFEAFIIIHQDTFNFSELGSHDGFGSEIVDLDICTNLEDILEGISLLYSDSTLEISLESPHSFVSTLIRDLETTWEALVFSS